MNGVIITEEPADIDVFHPQDRRELLKDIQLLEVAMFSKKERLSKMPHIHGGKIIIPPPSPYCCKSCGNDGCLDRETEFATVIANVTAAHGCLDWLPPKGKGVL